LPRVTIEVAVYDDHRFSPPSRLSCPRASIGAFRLKRHGHFLVRPHPITGVRVPRADEPINSAGDALTVCIAARCGGVIVAASDRMLTAGDVQFEPASGLKIQPFSNFAFIMTAGDAALTAEIVQDTGAGVRNRIESEPSNIWAIKDIVDLFVYDYNLAKVKRSEAQILAPPNLDRKTFTSEQRQLSDGFVSDLTKELINFELSAATSAWSSAKNARKSSNIACSMPCHDDRM
jgi:hypothetical protein